MRLGNHRLILKFAVGGMIVSGFWGAWFFWRQDGPSAGHTPGPSPRPSPLTQVVSFAQPSVPPTQLSLNDIAHSLERTVRTEDALQRLAELQAFLAGIPAQEASAAIRQFLNSRLDAPTKLDFKVGSDGFLASAPSLRVFLLDQWARLDAKAAAEYARVILAGFDSPDEWAVSLRTLARADSGGEAKAYLQPKVLEMFRYEPWQQQPAVGYLEAFDVAVYLGSADLVPPLTDLVRKRDNSAVAHAAYLALDRLTIAAPATTLEMLQANPELMKGREVTRANYFARADVGDPNQRTILENYLLDPNHSAEELNTFVGLFPNANYMVSHNLLTRVETPDGATIARRDRAALQVVEGWLADPRFSRLQPRLQELRNRLTRLVVSPEGRAR